jgi:hypothetical protein
MGIINQGVYGGVSGKLGNLIGASWKGINYLRIKPASVANPRTLPQLTQRAKFLVTLKFLQPLGDFLKIGFKNYAVKMSPFNSAMSFTIQNALAGDYPDFIINYQNALLSRGSLTEAANAAAASNIASQVLFTWDDNSGDGDAQAADKAMLVVYNPVKGHAVQSTLGNSRADGSQVVNVPAYYSADTVQTWIAFLSATGQVSNSVYAGPVVVA